MQYPRIVMALAIVASACGETREPTCSATTHSPCTCDDGTRSTRVCQNDGEGWGSCLCGSAGADSTCGIGETPDCTRPDGQIRIEALQSWTGAGFNLAAQLYDVRHQTLLPYTHAPDTCAIRDPRATLCDPPCEGNEYCSVDRSCLAVPNWTTAGDITLRVKDAVAEVMIYDDSNCQVAGCYERQSGETSPIAAPGDTVEASALGATFPAFSIAGSFVEPIQMTQPQVQMAAVVLPHGTDLELAWTTSLTTEGGLVGIAMGGYLGDILECVARDDGSFTIAWELLASVRGNPDIYLFIDRERRYRVRLDGGRIVDLIASSMASQALFVE